MPGLEASEAGASRLRLMLRGSRAFEVGSGTLSPSLELGLRQDGGDAETGAGIEAGGGIRYAGEGVAVEGSVRTLVAHQESGYEEWGASGSIRIAGASGRGLSLTVAQSWGAAAGGLERMWSVRDSRELEREGGFEAGSRFESEIGYGMGMRSVRGTMTPYAGVSRDHPGNQTVRAGMRWAIGSDATLGLEGQRRNGDGTAAEQALMVRAAVLW